jgi:hypothetical protein
LAVPLRDAIVRHDLDVQHPAPLVSSFLFQRGIKAGAITARTQQRNNVNVINEGVATAIFDGVAEADDPVANDLTGLLDQENTPALGVDVEQSP